VRTVAPPAADAATLLSRALLADARGHGLTLVVDSWRAHPWASATFVGDRHAALLAIAGDADAWLRALPECELAVRGHLVADLTVTCRADGMVALEALTLADP